MGKPTDSGQLKRVTFSVHFFLLLLHQLQLRPSGVRCQWLETPGVKCHLVSSLAELVDSSCPLHIVRIGCFASFPTIIPQISKVNFADLLCLHINILSMSLDSSKSMAPTWLELLLEFCISFIY